MTDRIVHQLEPKQPSDVIVTPVLDFGPKLAAGETVTAVDVTVWELDRFGIEGADYTGQMLVPSSVMFSVGGTCWWRMRNGSDNKVYGARAKATIAPNSRTEHAILVLPVRLRMK